jgi:hypothetical protein
MVHLTELSAAMREPGVQLSSPAQHLNLLPSLHNQHYQLLLRCLDTQGAKVTSNKETYLLVSLIYSLLTGED